MDETVPPTNTNDEATPVKHEDELYPVAWTPEDASRFLTSAIHEAQKPLAEALKHRPITTSTLVLVLFIILAAGAGTGWILFTQLEKTERIADTARSGLDDALNQQHQLQARSDTLQIRLESTQAEQKRLNEQFQQESDSLRSQVKSKRDSEEDLRRIQTELARFRRQNELLKSQISGLEMEKQALSRQLDAVRAMADDDFDIPGAPQEEAEPQTEPPSTFPPLSSSGAIPAQEPPVAEALPVMNAPEPAAPQPAEPAEPAEPAVRITPMPEPATSTITVHNIAGSESETGTLTTGDNGGNPPTLYESIRMGQAPTSPAATDEPVRITGSVPPPAEVTDEPEALSIPEPQPEAEPADAVIDSGAVQYSKEITPEPAPAPMVSVEEEPVPAEEDAAEQPSDDPNDDPNMIYPSALGFRFFNPIPSVRA